MSGFDHRPIHTARRALIALLLSSLVYLLLAALFTWTEVGGSTLISRLLPLSSPGGKGHSLQRFREADSFPPEAKVDILIIGPSQSYRSIDPRWLREHGLTSVNLGSSAQTPLNTYYLLQHYVPKLRPRLILLAVSQHALSVDGLESLADLASNTVPNKSLAAMSLSHGSITAANLLCSSLFREIRKPLSQANQQPQVNDTYIPGGYVESNQAYKDHHMPASSTLHLLPEQLRYQQKCIDYLHSLKLPVLAFSSPLTPDYLGTLQNYSTNYRSLLAQFSDMQVPYLDLNFHQPLPLHPREDFFDELHLNAHGVKKMNDALWSWLEKKLTALP